MNPARACRAWWRRKLRQNKRNADFRSNFDCFPIQQCRSVHPLNDGTLRGLNQYGIPADCAHLLHASVLPDHGIQSHRTLDALLPGCNRVYWIDFGDERHESNPRRRLSEGGSRDAEDYSEQEARFGRSTGIHATSLIFIDTAKAAFVPLTSCRADCPVHAKPRVNSAGRFQSRRGDFSSPELLGPGGERGGVISGYGVSRSATSVEFLALVRRATNRAEDCAMEFTLVELAALILISLWGLTAIGKVLQRLSDISRTLNEIKLALRDGRTQG